MVHVHLEGISSECLSLFVMLRNCKNRIEVWGGKEA